MRSLAQWLALQESVHPKSIDMGLERVARVARSLGVDKPTARIITVGGTNGKGSTCAHLESILEASGVATGLFTSPHFIRYNERIRVHSVEVSDAELISAFERIEAARSDTTLTFFEYNTLAALLIFAERSVGIAILEVGLGGRLDATNLIDSDVAVLCSVGFDHRDYLGDSLEQIGAEKAGIFRAGRPAVLGTADMPASVYAALHKLGARGVVAGRDFNWHVQCAGGLWDYEGVRTQLQGLPASALLGSIQYGNAAAALAAIESLGKPDQQGGDPPLLPELSARVVSEGLRRVRMAGRFQVVPGPVEWILDIAHNEPAAQVFAAQVRERARHPGGRTLAVLGILADKDARQIVTAVRPVVDQWILCSLPGPRGSTSVELARKLSLPAGEVTLAESVEAGCERARAAARAGDRILVFGSVYTVGPALQWLGLY